MHKDALSLFHINTCSLTKNTEEPEYQIDKISFHFDVIGISESSIKKNKSPINSINLKDYSHETCPTEYSAGWILLYISNHLFYKPRGDLCIYKSAELESTCNEILNPTNVIKGFI